MRAARSLWSDRKSQEKVIDRGEQERERREEEEEERERERERYTGRETQKKEEALVCAQVEDLKALGAFFAFGEGGKRLGKDASQGRRVL